MSEPSAPPAATAPWETAGFAEEAEPLRPELRAHCYRMLGSFDDAEDAVQETLLRAWRGRQELRDRGALRSWLYTVATRVCLDSIRLRARRVLPSDLAPPSDAAVVGDPPAEGVPWLGPYPDTGLGLDRLSPEVHYEQREAVELAFVAALQHLTGNQRAALLLFEVVGLTAAEIATTLGTSAAAVNSALERARRILATRVREPGQRQTLAQLGNGRVRELVARFCGALERHDPAELVTLLTADATWSMPPLPHWYRGLDAVMDFAERVPLGNCGAWLHRPVAANGQPAVALYLRPEGSPEYRAWSINVLTLRGDHIRDITSFIGESHFPAFDLPLAPDFT